MSLKQSGPVPEHADLKRCQSLAAYRTGPLASLLAAGPSVEIASAADPAAVVAPEGSQAAVFSGYRLQDIANYRLALQTWFRAVRPGGHLVVVVPHAFLYERQNVLPSPWAPEQRRLYTPGSLSAEVEEALAPNTYRMRWLGDDDAGYDYARAPALYPAGRHDIVLVLEKIAAPAWVLSERPVPEKKAPDQAFEPPRTRVETLIRPPHGRILLLKLDHLGDFIMGLPALERTRAAFPDAAITLVVGSWNEAMARELGLFQRIVAFDAFPRNSSEERADVRGKVSAFAALIEDEYDLAIDLRSDHDTRVLLERVRAGTKAGIGNKGAFPYLDIFLPIDASRGTEAAWSSDIPAEAFLSRTYIRRNRFELACQGGRIAKPEGAMIWGPYRHLAVGRYLFEPFVVFDETRPGVLRFDAALDEKIVAQTVVSGGPLPTFRFSNEKDGARVEFRFWVVDGEPVPAFQLYGGRLVKQGTEGTLHQSEYLSLLVELVAMRVARHGLLGERGPSA